MKVGYFTTFPLVTKFELSSHAAISELQFTDSCRAQILRLALRWEKIYAAHLCWINLLRVRMKEERGSMLTMTCRVSVLSAEDLYSDSVCGPERREFESILQRRPHHDPITFTDNGQWRLNSRLAIVIKERAGDKWKFHFLKTRKPTNFHYLVTFAVLSMSQSWSLPLNFKQKLLHYFCSAIYFCWGPMEWPWPNAMY